MEVRASFVASGSFVRAFIKAFFIGAGGNNPPLQGFEQLMWRSANDDVWRRAFVADFADGFDKDADGVVSGLGLARTSDQWVQKARGDCSLESLIKNQPHPKGAALVETREAGEEVWLPTLLRIDACSATRNPPQEFLLSLRRTDDSHADLGKPAFGALVERAVVQNPEARVYVAESAGELHLWLG